MNIIENEKEISIRISSELEYLIKNNKTKAKDISDFIGITEENFSRIRNRLKSGKFPTFAFIAGITKFFNVNFFEL